MRRFIAGIAAVLCACGTSDDVTEHDAGEVTILDGTILDAASIDAVVVDSGTIDSGVWPDAEASDLGSTDAVANDATPVDMGTPDSGADAGTPTDSGAPVGLNPGWIGGACASDNDCAFTGGHCLTAADGWPEGTCTEGCTQFCPDLAGPMNAVTFCIDDGAPSGDGICVSRCDETLSPTGCRAGYVCLPERRQGQASVIRYACVPQTGVPNRPTPAFDIGEACASAADCGYNACITDLPAGYCTQEKCDVIGCPTGSVCFGFGLEGYTACLKSCATSTECRQSDGYSCDTDNTCWAVPPPPPTCVTAGAAADCAAYAAQASNDFVVVTKSLRRMAFCSGASLVDTFCVGLGSSPVEDKEREGDRRTPEGIFYIPRKIPASQYYKAFLISYPDIQDAARGLADGLITQSEHDAIVAAQNARTEPPQSTALGGLVEIHGNGSGADWTWGCVATEDSNIDLLWPDLGVGDTVVILH